MRIDDEGKIIDDFEIPIANPENNEYKEGAVTIGPSLNLALNSGIHISNIGLANFNTFSIKENGFTKRYNISFLRPSNQYIIPIVNNFSWQFAWGWGYSFIHNKRSILSLTGGLGFSYGMTYNLFDFGNSFNYELAFFPIMLDLSWEIFFGKSSKDGISIGVTGYFGGALQFSTDVSGADLVYGIIPRIAYAHRFGD